MQKLNHRGREISFYSTKNQCSISVRSRIAREYTLKLERDDEVLEYQANIPLERKRYQYVNPVDIRKEYFATNWVSDFFIRRSNNQVAVRELVRKSDIGQRATIEKLEFSRRYWKSLNITDWKIVVWEDADVF